MIPSAPVTTLPIAALGAVLLGLLMHWWPRLGVVARRRVSIASSAAGLAFLVAAMRAEGLRESAITSLLIVGPAYHTATSSASASLYYYVLTALCLTLGFAGLVFGESLSAALERRPLASAVLVAWTITAARFLLEKSAAPATLTQAVGVTLVAPIAGAYLAACLRDAGLGRRELLRQVVAYAFLVRGFVAVVGVAATRLGAGTHYDVSNLTSVSLAFTGETYRFEPGSASQVFWMTLVPQLVAWPAYTVAAAFLAGTLVLRLAPPPLERRRPAPEGRA
jgi:hypothetical protein